MNPPRLKPRVEWVRVHPTINAKGHYLKCSITDARDLTAEQAIAKCIKQAWINTDWAVKKACKAICPQGYSAAVKNGKVKVRRIEE